MAGISQRWVALMAFFFALAPFSVAQGQGYTSDTDDFVPGTNIAWQQDENDTVRVYSRQEINQLVAPIALYPDALVGQILMAAAYPLEIVTANRWLQESNHASLQGDALAEAMEDQPWAPSVKALVAFPQILSMMDSHLQWTEQLGEAFIAQQDDVMGAVQNLRRMAFAAGTLRSTPQQAVVSSDNIIYIRPVSPQIVYLPYYDPNVVYGAWPWPTYPPYYFPPFVGLTYYRPGVIFFTRGTIIIPRLFIIKTVDFHRHRIHIDHDRFVRINRGRAPLFRDNIWRFDREHRHDVPYRRLSTEGRHVYRGYPSGHVSPTVRRNATVQESAPAAVVTTRSVTPNLPRLIRQDEGRGGAIRVDRREDRRESRRETRVEGREVGSVQQQVIVPQQAPAPRVRERIRTREIAPPVRVQTMAPTASRSEVERESRRGRESRAGVPTTTRRIQGEIRDRRDNDGRRGRAQSEQRSDRRGGERSGRDDNRSDGRHRGR